MTARTLFLKSDLDTIYSCFLKCSSISTDTRTVEEGALFIALKGANFDGNRYASQALKAGARFAVVSDPSIVQNDRYLLVNDTLDSLQELARLHRSRMSCDVISLTGSNGKTTTKELLNSVLSTRYKVSATAGNYNNHIGVPLTILSTPRDTEILIVEMGTNQPGDIAQLCAIADPQLGLITNIGASHLEKLISLAGVFKEKSELYDHVMGHQGHFFLNVGDEMLCALDSKLDQVTSYDRSEGPYGKLLQGASGGDHLVIKLVQSGREHILSTQLSGSYNLENISAALTIAHHYDIGMAEASSVIGAYRPNNMRSQIVTTARNTLIVDAYNANPSSMEASIRGVLDSGRDTLTLILGDMLELGTSSTIAHRDMVHFLIKERLDDVKLVGEAFGTVIQDRYPIYKSVQDLIGSGALDDIMGRRILIKASRGIELEKAIPHL